MLMGHYHWSVGGDGATGALKLEAERGVGSWKALCGKVAQEEESRNCHGGSLEWGWEGHCRVVLDVLRMIGLHNKNTYWITYCGDWSSISTRMSHSMMSPSSLCCAQHKDFILRLAPLLPVEKLHEFTSLKRTLPVLLDFSPGVSHKHLLTFH